MGDLYGKLAPDSVDEIILLSSTLYWETGQLNRGTSELHRWELRRARRRRRPLRVKPRRMRVEPVLDDSGAHHCATLTYATADAGAYCTPTPGPSEADASPYTSTRRSSQSARFRADA